MLDLIKKNIENFFKTFIDHLYKEKRFVNDRLTIAYVERFLDKHAKLNEIENPSHYLKFCFDLFSEKELDVKKVKWNEQPDIKIFKRFSRLVQRLETSLPGYNSSLSEEILEVANKISGRFDEMPDIGMDVAEHFRSSSSFGVKGKLLFNIVRFMRPTNCIEIGTAYGMSAYFCLHALDRYSENGKLWTIEAAHIQYQTSSVLLNKRFSDRVTCLEGYSNECLPQITKEVKKVDYYFHDGGHYFDNIVNNFNQIKPYLASGSVVIIDDIRWWDKMLIKNDPRCYEAWKTIIDDPIINCAVEVNGSVGIAIVG